MSTPNFAYCYGSTPSSGGYASLEQAIASALLGVNTTVATAVTTTGSQVVTPAAMTHIGKGSALWINWGLSDQECVVATAITGSTFTATFTKTHAANMTVITGLPLLGASSPWATAAWSPSGSPNYVDFLFRSTVNSPDGNASEAWIGIGSGSSSASTSLGFFTAMDFDILSGNNNNVPKYAAGYSYSNPNQNANVNVQDATFKFWICVCEYALVVVTLVAGTYNSAYAGSLRRSTAYNNCGVALATSSLANAATSIPVDRNLTGLLTVGQQVYVCNKSHNASSTNWSAGGTGLAKVTLTAITSTTLTVSALPHAFDTGAMVGAIVPNVVIGGTAIDQGSVYLSHNNDGTWTGYTNQSAAADYAVVTQNANQYNSPSLDPIASVVYGEADLPVNQTTAGYYGYSGFFYGIQEFGGTSISNEDTFYDQGYAWKAFKGAQCFAIGPLLNALNTAISPNNWQP